MSREVSRVSWDVWWLMMSLCEKKENDLSISKAR